MSAPHRLDGYTGPINRAGTGSRMSTAGWTSAGRPDSGTAGSAYCGGLDVIRDGVVLGQVINGHDGWHAYTYAPVDFVALEFEAVARTRGSGARWLVPQADDPCV